MKLVLNKEFKSLQPFTTPDLPNFTVITGYNGAGKSQFLRAITTLIPQTNSHTYSQNYQNIPYVNITPQDIPFSKRHQLYISSISFNESRPYLYHQWKSEALDKHIKLYKNLKENSKKLISHILLDNIDIKSNLQINIRDWSFQSITKEQLDELLPKVFQEFFPGSQHNKNIESSILKTIVHYSNINSLDVFKQLTNYLKVPFTEITLKAFEESPLDEFSLSKKDLFSINIGDVFYAYFAKRLNNRAAVWFVSRDLRDYDVVPDELFEESYTPPWTLVNDFFEKNNIPFEFKVPNFDTFDPEKPINFSFIHKTFNCPISISDLSTGERKIMSLLLTLYLLGAFNNEVSTPQLIVLDEPDTGLHPEICKLLLDTLQSTFVEKLGIKVIITTHSPSTVALSPEDSLFKLNNKPSTSLTKVSKDKALKILTGNIPTLSIDYSNHKQVFVESPYDLMYYQQINNTLTQKYKYNYKLYFMSNKLGKGDCNQVRHIINNLNESGIDTCIGIIDWDNENNSETNIYVHGENGRYSLENFLCDPIFLAMLFIKDNGANNIISKLGFPAHYNYGSIASESCERLQEISDWIISHFQESKPKYKLEKEKYEIKYINGKSHKVPKWFVTENGHELETLIINSFKSMKGRYLNDREQLKTDLLNVILGSYDSGLIPIETKKLIDTISS